MSDFTEEERLVTQMALALYYTETLSNIRNIQFHGDPCCAVEKRRRKKFENMERELQKRLDTIVSAQGVVGY